MNIKKLSLRAFFIFITDTSTLRLIPNIRVLAILFLARIIHTITFFRIPDLRIGTNW